MKKKIIILSTLMMVIFSSVLTSVQASESFIKVKPTNVPEFYNLEDEDKQLYSYITKNKETLYRLYGEIIGKTNSLGYYNSNKNGELVYPLTLIDITEDEKNINKVKEEVEEPGEDEKFLSATPENIPEYYEVQEEIGIFTYKKKDGNTYYRIYGTYEDMAEGFYACDIEGYLIEPFVPLDQTEEANNAYNSGVESSIEDELKDNEAFINNVKVEQVTDGTAPFDGNNNPGNDEDSSNGIIRTFDTLTYTVSYQTNLQNQMTTTYFKNGWVYVEMELPCTFKEAKFNIEAMTWLEDAKQEEKDGKIVLKGKQRLQAGDKQSVIPGTSSLKVVIEVLGMKNGATIQPKVTLSMPGNSKDQNVVKNLDEIKVSAAPSYNIDLRRNEKLQWKDNYDFSTGNADANNKDAGTVNGRLYGFGISLELRNGDTTKGLKGIELPKGKMTFDLELTAKKNGTDITGTGADQVMPLLWDYKGNSNKSSGNDSRNMLFNGITFGRRAEYAAPYNSFKDSEGSSILSEIRKGTSVVDGGNWKAKQTNNIISVEVDTYDFLDENNEYYWPVSTAGRATLSPIEYGVEKGRGVFSAGFFQILFPLPSVVEESSVYNMEVKDYNFKATSITDVKVNNDNQVSKTDDYKNVMLKWYHQEIIINKVLLHLLIL